MIIVNMLPFLLHQPDLLIFCDISNRCPSANEMYVLEQCQRGY